MQESSHDGKVLSSVLLLNLHVFMSVKHLVVGRARRVSARACLALLCLLVMKLFMYLFVQHEGKHRRFSFCFRGHRFHSGMSCFGVYFGTMLVASDTRAPLYSLSL